MELRITDQILILPRTDELKIEKNGVVENKKLEPLSTKLVQYLFNRRGEVCSKENIIAEIWEGNQEVGKPALRKNIYKLRNIFSEAGEKDIIQTIPKKGYRIVGKSLPNETDKKSFKFKPKIIYIIGIVILVLMTLKIIFPGIIHRLLH